jgi:hypothetical protein
MTYTYKIHKPDGSTVNGIGMATLHDVVDHIEFHAFGKTLRDVYINDIHIEDVGLHVFEGKVVEEDGQPIVCCNKWYDVFARPVLSFRPQSVRPTNPATPSVKEKL